MPYKEKIIEKRYYSIGEVAAIFGVATSLIRFWETEFSILKPNKNRKGKSQETEEIVEKLKRSYKLVKERRFTLKGSSEMLNNEKWAMKYKIVMID